MADQTDSSCDPQDIHEISSGSDSPTINAMYLYYHWVSLRQLVYAVDIRHECAYLSEFEPVKNNEHSIMKVFLFDHNNYYGLRLMDSIFREEIPVSLLMFYCPCCLEEFWTPPTY